MIDDVFIMIGSGKLIINDFGNGFVNLEDKTIYIKKNNIQHAYNGEFVEVEYDTRDGLYFGKVINYSLVNKIFIGKVHHFYKEEIFIFCHELSKSKLVIIKTDMYLQKNDWVKIQIISDYDKIYGILLEVLPNDIDTIIEKKYNLDEITSINSLHKNNNHIDQTDLDTFTIDPENCKDCDDAFSIKMIDNKIHIYVHISDVAHYINPDIPEFDLIIERGNTKYGVNKNWPMIPKEYSENICSILPNKNTFVATNEFIYKNNKIEYVGFYYSIVKSKNKYNYDYVDSHFDTPEFKIIYDTSLLLKKEIPDIVMCKESNSHSMIRYWMITINILMCNKLYRCNPEPNESKFGIIKKYLQMDNINREELLQKINNEDVLTNFLLKKLMLKAYYTTEESNHYALGISKYTHWTSPIRRGCDLLNHCIIKGYDIDLQKYIEYININEAIQDEIENFIQDYNTKIDTTRDYEGIVIGLSATGVIIFIPELCNKYVIHISQLSSEKLLYTNNELTNGNTRIKLFDKLKTKLHDNT